MNRIVCMLTAVWTVVAFHARSAEASQLGDVREIACAPTDSRVIGALSGSTVWITADGGSRWSASARLRDLEKARIPEDEEVDCDDTVEVEGMGDREIMDLDYGCSDTEHDDGSGQTASREVEHVSLAISDGLTWAVSFGDRLHIGHLGQPLSRRISLPDVKGVIFDSKGRLWVTVENALLLLGQENGSFGMHERWTLTGAGAPVRGPTPNELMIPGREGVWLVSTGAGDERPGFRLYRLPAVKAVAAIPRRGSQDSGQVVGAWHVVSLGRLLKQDRDGSTQDLGAVPAGVKKLLVDARGGLRLFVGTSGWFERHKRSWRFLHDRPMAVDADGGFRPGAEPGGPPSRSEKRLGRSALSFDMESFSTSISDIILRPPPCRRFPFNPLPVVRAVVDWGRGAWRYGERSIAADHGQVRTGLFVGVTLTWRLEPVATSSCMARDRRWRDLRHRKAQRALVLWTERRRATMARRAARDLAAAIAARMDAERLMELSRTSGGGDLRGEEK